MSKQTNDKDERKAPSGQEQGDKERRAKAKRKGKSSTPSEVSPPLSSSPNKSTEHEPGSAAAAKASTASSLPAEEGTASITESASDKSKTSPAAGKPAADKPGGTDPSASKTRGAKASMAPTKAAPSGRAASPTSTAAPEGGGGRSGNGSSGGKGGRGAGALALILVLLLGIGAGLFAWNAWERLDAQQQRLVELESQTRGAADDVVGLRDQLEQGDQERDTELAEAIDAMQGEFASYRGEVDEALDQVLDELSREQDADPREWLHAEAAYLLRLANQRLQLERDVEGAAALLRTADARLNEADNPALLSIRRAIASELSILESVPQVDRTGLYLALNAQQERLAQLPLSRELEEIPARSGIQEAPSGDWQDQLSRFGQELKDLVVIRHHDEALEGLIAPEQESYLRQSARLILEQAQLALLKEEQGLYEASLDKAIALIEGYYANESSEVQAVIERLQALKGESIQPELPDISASQQALAEFIERRFGSRGDQGDDA